MGKVLKKMLNIRLVIINFLLFTSILRALEERDTLWTKTYGGDTLDIALASCVDSFGYYIVTGTTSSYGQGKDDIWVLKINPEDGETLWTRTYGGSDWDKVYSICVDDSGYYIVVGYTWGGYHDLWILKINPENGDTVWTKIYGESGDDVGKGVCIDNSGYYVVVGYTSSYGLTSRDFWILKINPENGETLWSRTYGYPYGDDIALSVCVDDSGYYIVAGYTGNPGYRDFKIMKIEPENGDTVWTKIYGGFGEDVAMSVCVDDSGYYVVVGYTDSYGSGEYDGWILKLDPSTGDTVWGRTYGGSDWDKGHSVHIDGGGYYIVGGYTQSYGAGDADFWVLKINPENGETLWTRTYGGINLDKIQSISVDKDDHYILVGYTNSYGNGDYDFWIVKLFGSDYVAPFIDSVTQLERDDMPPYGPYTVFCKITDNKSGVKNAYLFWRKSMDTLFYFSPMVHDTQDWWFGQIPILESPVDSYQVFYFVEAIDSANNIAYSETLSFWVVNPISHIVENCFKSNKIGKVKIYNDKETGIKILLNLANSGKVSIKVFSLSGRVTFDKKVILSRGFHVLTIPLNSGVYLVKVKLNGQVFSNKIALVR